jgi:hypothetical protein
MRCVYLFCLATENRRSTGETSGAGDSSRRPTTIIIEELLTLAETSVTDAIES